jgi:hypothetical protein
MALTKTQKLLLKEARGIAALSRLDFWDIEKKDKESRTPRLGNAITQMVRSEVVTQYTLLDEILTDLACRYYFKKKGKRFILWRQKKFRVFVNYIMDEMFLIKKVELVHAIRPLPKEVKSTVHRVNSLRNALAHSFFPENRKEHRKVGKVLYQEKNIRTVEGLKGFQDDCHTAWVYLARRAFGTWHD